MTIPISKYVNITSSVGGVAQAASRELILRLLTNNVLIPTGTVVEFSTIAEVGSYFGTDADEFNEAQFYFAFISKLATTPGKISFSRYALVDVAATVFGESKTYAIGDFDTTADGQLLITIGANSELVSFDFSSPLDTSLDDVASTMQTAIQAANGDPEWSGATVSFNATESRFELLGGAVGAFVMLVEPGITGTDIIDTVGWALPSARFSDGIVGTTLTAFLIAQAQTSNNFGSFSFIQDRDNTEVLEVATWNDGENVKYMYLQKVIASNTQTLFDSINQFGGTGLTLSDPGLTTDFPWLLPGAIMAATPYTRRAAVQDYMFQQASLASLVTDATLSTTYDNIRVNYYGETQQAGSILAFYQRGFLMGIATDPIDMGVYSNEVFLKDAVGVSIINLLLALSAVPANQSGVAQVLAAIQAPIDQALLNGTISIGKKFNATQIAFISVTTGDPLAFHQIQNSGYWIEAQIVDAGGGEFVVEYVLIYAKNDVIRKVEGSHLLI